MKKEMLILVLTGMMGSPVMAANAVISQADLTPGTTIQVIDANTIKRVEIQVEVLGKERLQNDRKNAQDNIDALAKQLQIWIDKRDEIDALLAQMK